jgi:nicotinate phosphoribosyltransferase
VSLNTSAMLTDFYQLTMAHAYWKLGMRDAAVFELFVRRLPRARRFLIAAGLEQALTYLEKLEFGTADLEFLASMKVFPAEFLDYLGTVRFNGTVDALAEGTPFFANEPILRVTAPILEAQLIESRLINLVHFQTLIASKAARCVLVAQGRRLIDFGMRRAHGAEAAILAARAAYLAGFDATATVEAGRQFGIPLSGTMAHSFIEAHDSEIDAFRNFLDVRGRRTVLLIDTYDTERAARRVVELSQGRQGTKAPGCVQGVRIDSGDLGKQASAVRRILDEQGCQDVEIVLSGNLDEYRIASLLAAHAPVNAFGVGTHLDVSADAPSLDMAYKLEAYAGRARRKRSPGKETWPGSKQVFREFDASGQMQRDHLVLTDEAAPGVPLLREVMHEGRRATTLPNLIGSREYCRDQLARLPPRLTRIEDGEGGYEVEVSTRLRALAVELDRAGE